MNRLLVGILRNFSDMSVRSKLTLGFSVVLVLHISIAVLGHYGLERAAHTRDEVAKLNSQVKTFIDIDKTVGELQRNVLLFAFAGFRSPQDRANELQSELDSLLETAFLDSSEETQHVLIEMGEHLDAHREIFKLVVVDRENRRELVETGLFDSGEKIDREFDALVNRFDSSSVHIASARSSFNAAQVHLMRFVHSPDSRQIRATKTQIDQARIQLRNLVAASRLSDDDVATSLKMLDAFERLFIEMVQATRGYLHLVNVVLAGEVREFSYLASSSEETYRAQAETLAQSMELASQRFQLASNVFSVITIVLGIAAAVVIDRCVAPPLNSITQAIDGLAKGESLSVVPGSERKDELGRLAAAAQVFRDKAAQTERLLEEVTRMREKEKELAQSHRLESLGRMAAGIAHEINTPLQCVASNVEFLENGYDVLTDVIDLCCQVCDDVENDAEEQGKVVGRLRELTESRRFNFVRSETPKASGEAADAVRRVVQIISAMKDMSHPGVSSHVSTDVNKVVENACTLSRNRWKGVAIVKTELAEDLASIQGQPAELCQVLMNLIVNAADAISGDETVPGVLGTITVRTMSSDMGVRIEVQDNGSGIPAHIKNRIFDPFFTTKDVGKGTGQGLAITYDIVTKRHAGEIDVTSDCYGTTFVIDLPVEQAEQRCIIDEQQFVEA
ncbi:MAG: ATP-binding protein [Rubripirellula sp.]